MNIYCITNKVNGKKYIGQTVRSVEERWKSHCSAARNGSVFRFHSAIRKYGEDSFNVEIIYSDLNCEYGRMIEEQLIYEHSTMDRQTGYNARSGGCGGWIVKPENYDKWLEKITKCAHAENNPRWSGYSDEFIIEECVKIYNTYLDKNDFSFSDILKKLREKYKGIPTSFSKNRFSSYPGRFREALAKGLDIPIEDLIKHARARSKSHRKSLSDTNTNKNWYSNDKLAISKQFKITPNEDWYRGRKYGCKN